MGSAGYTMVFREQSGFKVFDGSLVTNFPETIAGAASGWSMT